MNYPKLKNTAVCKFLLLLPILIFVAIMWALPIFFPQLQEGFDAFIHCILSIILLILILIYCLIAFFLNIALQIVTLWKKDRLYYYFDFKDKNKNDVLKMVSQRIKLNQCSTDNYVINPHSVYYKKSPSFTSNQSAFEKIVILFNVDYLDEKTYDSIMNISKKITKSLKTTVEKRVFFNQKEDKSPVSTGSAVIILANRTDIRIPETVRELKEFKDTAIVPCVLDFSSKRCYFNGMKEPNLGIGKPVQNIAIDLIVRYVFNKKLPLKNNYVYDYSLFNESDFNPETPFIAFIKDTMDGFIDEHRKSKKDIKKYGQILKDGDIVYEDDMLYIKFNNRLVAILTEQDEQNIEVIMEDSWSYPKKSKITKQDRKFLKQQIKNYFSEQNINVKFLSE